MSWLRALLRPRRERIRDGGPAPVVEAVDGDGQRIPLRLIRGRVERGIQMWEAFGPADVAFTYPPHLRVRYLPAKAGISLIMSQDPNGFYRFPSLDDAP